MSARSLISLAALVLVAGCAANRPIAASNSNSAIAGALMNPAGGYAKAGSVAQALANPGAGYAKQSK